MKRLRMPTILPTMAVLTILIAGTACQAPPPPPPPDPAAEMRPMVDTLIEVWNTKDYDKLDAVMAADVKRTAPDESVEGLEALKDFMRQAHAAYPDFRIVADEVHFAKDGAFLMWTVTGTNTGEGTAPPTGNAIEVSGITMLRVADGKVVEEVVQYDTATLKEQLGGAALPHARQDG